MELGTIPLPAMCGGGDGAAVPDDVEAEEGVLEAEEADEAAASASSLALSARFSARAAASCSWAEALTPTTGRGAGAGACWTTGLRRTPRARRSRGRTAVAPPWRRSPPRRPTGVNTQKMKEL